MLFTRDTSILEATPPPKSVAVLVDNDWDDWFKFSTVFWLIVFDDLGERHEIGRVKIGQRGMVGNRYSGPSRRAELPQTFDRLDDTYFSLGQGEDYYSALHDLEQELRARILKGLRDVVLDDELFTSVAGERVMIDSLLREVSADSVRGRYRDLLAGVGGVASYKFTFQLPIPPSSLTAPLESLSAPVMLEFEVERNSVPPTNIHVLIGTNGAGKTRCLRSMARSLVEGPDRAPNCGQFAFEDRGFANLISVSFSAFDPFGPIARPHLMPYWYIGLLRAGEKIDEASPKSSPKHPPKTLDELTNDFVDGVQRCRSEGRAALWRDALETLETDDFFGGQNIAELADESASDWEARARELYPDLSSGHKIVLLTVARLIGLVDERSLVLLDEPEAHLHPPLLAALVRCLSALMASRNGVAIVATHSPVILQEVPKNCAWMISREGEISKVERPPTETFGENVGILTRDVFRLEVERAGFRRMLEGLVEIHGPDFDAVLAALNGRLGAEGRAVLRAMTLERARRPPPPDNDTP